MTDHKTFLQEVIDKADAALVTETANVNGKASIISAINASLAYEDTLSPDKAKALAQALIDVLNMHEPMFDRNTMSNWCAACNRELMHSGDSCDEYKRLLRTITSALGKNGEGE